MPTPRRGTILVVDDLESMLVGNEILTARTRGVGVLDVATVQQYVVPSLPSEVNVVYWSLTTEVHFYVLAPFFALALARFGGRRTPRSRPMNARSTP